MKLRIRGCKANGTPDNCLFWYVVSEYMYHGTPSFTMSTDINKAKYFTKEEAVAFNNKFIALGKIDKGFDIVK